MNIEKISAALSAAVLGALALVTVLKLNVAQNYSDFIVGSIAWDAGNKLQDLIVWPVVTVVFFLGFIALSKVITNSADQHGAKASASLQNQLILCATPFYVGVAGLFLSGTLDNSTTVISALGIVFIGAASFFHNRSQSQLDPDIFGPVFLVIIFIALVPIEAALLFGRSSPGLAAKVNANANTFIKVTYYLLVLGFIAGVFSFARSGTKLQQHFPKIIFLAQLGLPIFFLTLYPARLLQPSGELIGYKTTIFLKIFIIGLVLVGWYDVTSRFKKYYKTGDWRKLFSPFAIFALLAALKMGITIGPYINPDDYHFGESLLGWWSYLKGSVPYVDYIPAHGLIDDDLRQFLSSIFFDSTAASVGEAGRLAVAILGFAAFISIYRFSGSVPLAAIVFMLLGGPFSWFFLIPFVCLWLSQSLRAQPAKWLVVWLLTVPVVILGVPPQGLLLVAGSSVLAARLAWEQAQTGHKRSWIYIGSAALLLLALFVATPLLPMLLGAIRYLLENGPINQLAYGVPWNLSWATGIKSMLVLEAIRMSWVVVLLLCLYVVYKEWRHFKNPQSPLYPAAFFLIFMLLFIPYSMGRVDPGGVSRPGSASIFGWTVLFPLLAWGMVRPNTRAPLILLVAFMSALIGVGSISFSSLLKTVSASIHTLPLRDTAKMGLPNIGRAYVDDVHLDRIARLDALLKTRLAPDETYLDLTSRNAHYYYVNRAPAMAVTAPYNLVSPTQQKRAVKQLGSPPKLALLQGDNIVYDGGGLALRNPYLYRFVIDNYIPRFESKFIVGYKKPATPGGSDTTTITAEIKNITDVNWVNGINRFEAAVVLSDSVLVSMLKPGDQFRLANGETRDVIKVTAENGMVWLTGSPMSAAGAGYPNPVLVLAGPQTYQEYAASLFQRAFAVSDFKKIPVSWGRSEASLGKKMTLVKSFDTITPVFNALSRADSSYKVGGVDPYLSFDLSSLDLSGHSAGLLKFDFTCTGQIAPPTLQVFWWGDGREGPFEASSIRFTAENGTLIAPLDASPWWLTLQKIKGIRLDLDNPTACQAVSIDKAGLYQRALQAN